MVKLMLNGWLINFAFACFWGLAVVFTGFWGILVFYTFFLWLLAAFFFNVRFASEQETKLSGKILMLLLWQSAWLPVVAATFLWLYTFSAPFAD